MPNSVENERENRENRETSEICIVEENAQANVASFEN